MHQSPTTIKGYQLEIEPKEKWRRFTKRLNLEGWHLVGKKIVLVFKLIKLDKNANPLIYDYSIWVQYPNEDHLANEFEIPSIQDGENFSILEFERALLVSQQGSLTVYLASKRMLAKDGIMSQEKYPLYSAEIISGDIVFRDVILVIFGGVVGALITLFFSHL